MYIMGRRARPMTTVHHSKQDAIWTVNDGACATLQKGTIKKAALDFIRDFAHDQHENGSIRYEGYNLLERAWGRVYDMS
jgi:hypothetical protein